MSEIPNWSFGRLNSNREIRPLLLNGGETRDSSAQRQGNQKETSQVPSGTANSSEFEKVAKEGACDVKLQRLYLSMPWFLLTFSFFSNTPTDYWAEKTSYTQSQELVSSAKIGQKGWEKEALGPYHSCRSLRWKKTKQNKTKNTNWLPIDDKNQHLSGTALKHIRLR